MLRLRRRIPDLSEMRRAVLIEWEELSRMTKIFYIAGIISFIGLAIMILTGMTSLGAIWEHPKRCPFCM
jgi:hypothetical protein